MYTTRNKKLLLKCPGGGLGVGGGGGKGKEEKHA